jgi:hypothetical protein
VNYKDAHRPLPNNHLCSRLTFHLLATLDFDLASFEGAFVPFFPDDLLVPASVTASNAFGPVAVSAMDS